MDALQASEDQLRGIINTVQLLENEVGSIEETDAGDDLDTAASSADTPTVPVGSSPSVPSVESAERILRGAGGRRSSWADGGSAEAVGVEETQTNDANAGENCSPASVAEMRKKLELEQEQQEQQQRAPPSRYSNCLHAIL
eukprot:COSAG02_NODE_1960_length_10257_cov_48.153278_7_plen_141_part_00